jgi:hypothetical protein
MKSITPIAETVTLQGTATAAKRTGWWEGALAMQEPEETPLTSAHREDTSNKAIACRVDPPSITGLPYATWHTEAMNYL